VNGFFIISGSPYLRRKSGRVSGPLKDEKVDEKPEVTEEVASSKRHGSFTLY